MIKNRMMRFVGGVLPLISVMMTATAWGDTSTTASLADADSSTVQSGAITDGLAHQQARFGFSLGMGELAATGNRGLVWQASSPMYDLALYYWLTPELAIDIEGFSANASEGAGSQLGTSINVKHLEFATRYYFDVHQLLSRIAPGFISPFATVGAGVYSMSFWQNGTQPADTELGMTLGGGLRFEVVPRTLSLELLGRWNSVTFQDTYSQAYQTQGAPDLTGQFVSWNANAVVSF